MTAAVARLGRFGCRLSVVAASALVLYNGMAVAQRAPAASAVPVPRAVPAASSPAARTGVLAASAPAASASAVTADAGAELLSHGLFDNAQVYRPPGQVRQFVMLLSDTEGWGVPERSLARALSGAGALVVGIDTAAFVARLEADGGACAYAAGAFENLSHHVQAFHRLPTYLTPVLVGRGIGAGLSYAVLAQGEPGTFGGALSIRFCPDWPFRLPICGGRAMRVEAVAGAASAVPAAAAVAASAPPGRRWLPARRLPAPWTVMQPAGEGSCPAAQAFVEQTRDAQWRALPGQDAPGGRATVVAAVQTAYAELAARNAAPLPQTAGLSDLPIVEVPASGEGQRFAVLLSGDGGWAGIDKDLAAALARRGVPVAGFDSLRYFWSERTPEGLAADLSRVIRHYAAQWNRSEVVLIGYSQGADVLPFALNRLDPATRARIRLTALLSLGQQAAFEFHVTNWIGPSGDKPIAPEARKLDAADVLCVYGTEDKESICPQLPPANARLLALPGGHHFDGDYDKLARLILERITRQ